MELEEDERLFVKGVTVVASVTNSGYLNGCVAM